MRYGFGRDFSCYRRLTNLKMEMLHRVGINLIYDGIEGKHNVKLV